VTLFARPHYTQDGFIGTIYPNGDTTITNWEDESAGTTNLYSHVNDGSDSTYVQTDEIVMSFCGGSESSRILKFAFDNPSSEPSGSESTIIYVRAKLNGYGSSQNATMQMRMYDNTTLVQDQSSTHTLTTSWVWYAWVLTNAERHAYADTHNWSDFQLRLDFTICEDSGDSVRVAVSEIYVNFS
jgi:hypothetical protein